MTACPYKGTTSGYWTAHLGDTSYSDIAWTYDFPTRQLLPIAGLIAFYNEKVDTFLDGLLDRPVDRPTRYLAPMIDPMCVLYGDLSVLKRTSRLGRNTLPSPNSGANSAGIAGSEQ